jgi:hypothetical protein
VFTEASVHSVKAITKLTKIIIFTEEKVSDGYISYQQHNGLRILVLSST